jgi:hypothetical protein
MTLHRIDVLASGVADLVDQVNTRQISRAGLLVAVMALDVASVRTDGVVTEVLTCWRGGRPLRPTQRLSVASLRGRFDAAAFAAAHAGRTADHRAEFARARAVAAVEFGTAGIGAVDGGRDGLREAVCEACAAIGSTSLVANLLRDHIGD